MNKKDAIFKINNAFNSNLTNANTSYSSINKRKDVWWLNIPLNKFDEDYNLLLNDNKKIIWIKLPYGFVESLHESFRIRDDKDAVDLEISSNPKQDFLIDIKSKGTRFDFGKYLIKTICLDSNS